MEGPQPSRTALKVAVFRATHQLRDAPPVFDDPLATRIIGPDGMAEMQAERRPHGRISRAIRAFISVRSRFAEDELARAVARGTSQYVVLGAGLDTFAYRSPFPTLRVFEVDYPATQAWKRQLLASAGIAVPPAAVYAPVDFERDTLEHALSRAGLDFARPAFFSWLGVSMYLSDDAIATTLGTVAALPPGGGIVFDYAVPRASLSFISRLVFDALARRVARAGEPFRSSFEPQTIASRLASLGFHDITDLDGAAINARYFQHRADGLRVGGSLGRLLSAER